MIERDKHSTITLAEQAIMLVSGVVLVVLAVIAGVTLTANLLALLVYQQRQELAAAKALGVSSSVLVGTAASQGLVLGMLGGAVGLEMTPVASAGLNAVAEQLEGFEELVQPLILSSLPVPLLQLALESSARSSLVGALVGFARSHISRANLSSLRLASCFII